MAGQAEVRSTDTLAFVKSALATFAYECGQALAEVELEGRRGVDWITVDQAGYWKAEIRRRGEKVNEAMKDLERCRAFKGTGDGPPACTDEKKNLEKARRKLQVAEEKAEAVRHWTPIVQQQFREAGVKLVHFREVLDVDIPKALARVERMLKALDAYRQTASPAGGTAAGETDGDSSMRRSLDEDPQASGGAQKAEAGSESATPEATGGNA
ncbi:MAG: hypothetical protein ACO3NZ_02965 [Pirellulales bacterium]|jgi:hypothetical protein